MKKEFIDLLKNTLFANWKDPLIYDDYKSRKKKWDEDKSSLNSYNLVNPYYIGFGNPDSDILFIGKEQAFNLNSDNEDEKDLLFHENLNNYWHWKKLVEIAEKVSGFKNIDTKIFVKDYGFCPLFPLAGNFYNKEIFIKTFKNTHTWKKYEKLVNLINNKKFNYDENTNSLADSFFSECFITELSPYPKRSGGKFDYSEFKQKRLNLFKHPFFKTFKIVIIGARNYLSGIENQLINQIFNNTIYNTLNLDGNRLKCNIYKSDSQKIFVVDQLSGSAGWSNLGLEKLANLVKK